MGGINTLLLIENGHTTFEVQNWIKSISSDLALPEFL